MRDPRPYYLVYGGWYCPDGSPDDPDDRTVYGFWDWQGTSLVQANMVLAEIQQYTFDFTGIQVGFNS